MSDITINKDGILAEFDTEDLTTFGFDLFLICKIVENIDKDYGEFDNANTERDIKRFNKVIELWNNKYKDIILKFISSGIQCKLKIFIMENENALRSVISKMNHFLRFEGKSKINAVFPEGSGENTLTLEEINAGKFDLIYSKDDMHNSHSPEFTLCSYYGMKNGFDKTIDLMSLINEFSFDVNIKDGLGWQGRYPNINLNT